VGELDDKLSAILGNQEAMSQIMALARSLGGEDASEGAAQKESSASEPVFSGTGDLGAILGEVDPRMIQLGIRVLQEYRREDDRKTALLAALRPFVREERYDRLDRAIQIAKLSRGLRVFLDTMRGEESPHV